MTHLTWIFVGLVGGGVGCAVSWARRWRRTAPAYGLVVEAAGVFVGRVLCEYEFGGRWYRASVPRWSNVDGAIGPIDGGTTVSLRVEPGRPCLPYLAGPSIDGTFALVSGLVLLIGGPLLLDAPQKVEHDTTPDSLSVPQSLGLVVGAVVGTAVLVWMLRRWRRAVRRSRWVVLPGTVVADRERLLVVDHEGLDGRPARSAIKITRRDREKVAPGWNISVYAQPDAPDCTRLSPPPGAIVLGWAFTATAVANGVLSAVLRLTAQ